VWHVRKCGKGPAKEQQHEAAKTEEEEAMTSQGTNPPLGCMPASRTMQTGQHKDKATSNGSWQNNERQQQQQKTQLKVTASLNLSQGNLTLA